MENYIFEIRTEQNIPEFPPHITHLKVRRETEILSMDCLCHGFSENDLPSLIEEPIEHLTGESDGREITYTAKLRGRTIDISKLTTEPVCMLQGVKIKTKIAADEHCLDGVLTDRLVEFTVFDTDISQCRKFEVSVKDRDEANSMLSLFERNIPFHIYGTTITYNKKSFRDRKIKEISV